MLLLILTAHNPAQTTIRLWVALINWRPSPRSAPVWVIMHLSGADCEPYILFIIYITRHFWTNYPLEKVVRPKNFAASKILRFFSFLIAD